jgi:uncharacterized membrane protein YkvA (DUF1232 family)
LGVAVAIAIGAIVAVSAVFVFLLLLAGRRDEARALVTLLPDCLLLVARLAADPEVSRRCKLLLLGLAGYLAFPLDLVPDFVPVAGQLDDVIVIALALRVLARSGGESLIQKHWRRPDESLRLVLQVAGR